MLKKVIPIALIIISCIVVLFFTQTETVYYNGGLLAKSDNYTEIREARYRDENIAIDFGKAEGCYVMYFTLHNPEVIVYYEGIGFANKLSVSEEEDVSFWNVVKYGRMSRNKIYLYHKKGFYKKPFKSLILGEIENAKEYDTLKEARRRLKE